MGKDDELKRNFAFISLFVLMMIVLSGCGKESPEEVLEKISDKWVETKGYDVKANMEIRSGNEPRLYNVEVWHTKPQLYRVNVSQKESNMQQTITRNEEGVFVSSPALGKTYQFKSDWPNQNSQAYLIGSLAADIKADKKRKMEETKTTYIFHVATRSNQKELLPSQSIVINKKSLLPKEVRLYDKDHNEQIVVKFDKITLGKTRAASEYTVEMEQLEQKDKPVSAEFTQAKLETHYPTISWEGVTKLEERVLERDGVKRIILTYGGDKTFTIIQSIQQAKAPDTVPVFAQGDLADLGTTIGAKTDNSISWDLNGMHFFLASDSMTQEEMMAVAASIQPTTMK